MTESEVLALVPDKSFIKYAGSNYKVAGYRKIFSVLFIEIYDEPPSDHIDSVKAENCKVVK